MICESNHGPAFARNQGINLATGKYIGFVDSDDYIDSDFYYKLYDTAIKTDADIVKTTALMIDNNGNKLSEFGPNFDDIRTSKSALSYSFTTCIYNRNFLVKNNIYFPTDLKFGEDAYFILTAALCANKIELINSTNYYYVRHNNSLDSNIMDLNKIIFSIQFVVKVIDLINDHKDLTVAEYNQTYLWKINYLLTDIFFRTHAPDVQQTIITLVKNLWHKYKYSHMYEPKYLDYVNPDNGKGIQLQIIPLFHNKF